MAKVESMTITILIGFGLIVGSIIIGSFIPETSNDLKDGIVYPGVGIGSIIIIIRIFTAVFKKR